MTTIAAYPILLGAAARRCGKGVRGVEKTGMHRHFDSEYAAPRDLEIWVAVAREGRAPCQFGTTDHASFWNGPRLMTAFAAQVLGQAMGTTSASSVPAYAAYRRRAANSAPGFDENF